MKVQNTQFTSSPTFGRIDLVRNENMSKQLTESITRSKAIKNFGRKFDGTLEIISLQSRRNPEENRLTLRCNIEPKNIFLRIKKFFSSYSEPDMFDLKTKASDEATLTEIINSMSKNAINKTYKKAFKNK